jgi:hypothetical protein
MKQADPSGAMLPKLSGSTLTSSSSPELIAILGPYGFSMSIH